MSEELLGQLLVLALVDSTSIGTLVIPMLMLLLAGGSRFDRFGFYLAIVAGLYFLLGLLMALGTGAVVDAIGDQIGDRTQYSIQAVLGIALLGASFWLYRRHKQQVSSGTAPDWGKRVSQGLTSQRTLALLATGAVTAEIATMLPYLAAIGLITQADLSIGVTFLTLLGYVFVMILPALVLFVAHRLLRSVLDPYLRRLSDWVARTSYDTLSWIAGIAGFYLAANALRQLL